MPTQYSKNNTILWRYANGRKNYLHLEIWTLLEYSTTDIIIVTEPCLQPSIYEKEVLLENYRFDTR